MIIVIGVAANKCDLSNQAEVNEREGMEFAKQINAVFQETSASIDCGINELFGKLAKKYISSLIKRSNEKKEEIIATRQEEEFRTRYQEWRELIHIEVNEEVWEALDFDMESVG